MDEGNFPFIFVFHHTFSSSKAYRNSNQHSLGTPFIFLTSYESLKNIGVSQEKTLSLIFTFSSYGDSVPCSDWFFTIHPIFVSVCSVLTCLAFLLGQRDPYVSHGRWLFLVASFFFSLKAQYLRDIISYFPTIIPWNRCSSISEMLCSKRLDPCASPI